MLSESFRNNLKEERSYENDYNFGIKNENEIVDLLNKVFNEEFVKTTDRYAPYDFRGSKGTTIEMKSRRNTYRKFPTTIIPKHKVLKTDDKHIFVFHFTDGSYYIQYDADKFNQYELKSITTSRKGIVDIPKLHFCIPIKDLIHMC
jgi:hypothetical protein